MIGELEEYLKDFDIVTPFTFHKKPICKPTITLPDIKQTASITRNSNTSLLNLKNLKSQPSFHTVRNESKKVYSYYLEYFVKLLVSFKYTTSKAEGCRLDLLGKRIVCRVNELLKKHVNIIMSNRI
jgi:hypothetical protein